jgi:hypothetical protein
MVYVRNFTLQKYIFHAKFTNVKWLFFLKKSYIGGGLLSEIFSIFVKIYKH